MTALTMTTGSPLFPAWALFAVGTWLGTYLVTPDADLATLTHAETRWLKRSRNPVMDFLRFHVGLLALELGYWPGRLLRHRGISHWPFVGAMVILGLMMLSPLGLIVLAWLVLADRLWLLATQEVVAGLAGFCTAHLVHTLVDKCC